MIASPLSRARLAVNALRSRAVDTVLLDMDGTLLDLRFDNYFWLELVPERFAQLHGLTIAAAREALAPRFAARQGTLEWYCTDFWSRELALDIPRLKREVSKDLRYLPGAESFLQELRRQGFRTILVTNAHPDTLAIKAGMTGLAAHFDALMSSHRFGAPKEHTEFWPRLAAAIDFDRARTLFVDDNLAVLRAAHRYGIAHVVAIAHPDSTLDVRVIEEFPAVNSVGELLLASDQVAQ